MKQKISNNYDNIISVLKVSLFVSHLTKKIQKLRKTSYTHSKILKKLVKKTYSEGDEP
jgi:uncharacterized protein Veg